MDGIADAILRLLAGADNGERLSKFLGALALVGVATAALIQAVKETVPVRRWFQGVRLRRWLAHESSGLGGILDELRALTTVPFDADEMQRQEVVESSAIAPRNAGRVALHQAVPADPSTFGAGKRAEQDLYDLAVDGDRYALLNLPSEEMASHMTAAMRAALENPHRHLALFLVGARLADRDDILVLVTDAQCWPGNKDEGIVRLAEGRARVWYHMQRAIAGFALSTGYRWKFYLQLTSFLLSAGMVAIALGGVRETSWVATLGQVAFVSALAGFLAPVARDLTVVLKRLREGKVS